jgi:hypothetical protein
VDDRWQVSKIGNFSLTEVEKFTSVLRNRLLGIEFIVNMEKQTKSQSSQASPPIKDSIFCIAVIAMALFGALGAKAANHCVRAGASGNGTGADWANAYTNLPSSLVRGDKYYIAAGSYGAHTFADADSGSSLITIIGATPGDHGIATNWSDSYAGQATWSSSGNTWTINTDNYVFEGQTGPGSAAHTEASQVGYGFKVSSSSKTDGVAPISTVPSNNITLRHIEVAGSTWGNSNASRVISGQGFSGSNWAIQYCYIHGGRCWISLWNCAPLLIEHCFMTNCGSGDASLHSAGLILYCVEPGVTVRYNYLCNMLGGSNTTYIEPQGTGKAGLFVYGNVFWAYNSQESTGQGEVAVTTSDYTTDIQFNNNTCYGLHNWVGVWLGHGTGSSWKVYNNIWQGSGGAAQITGDHVYGSSDVVASANNMLNGGASFVDPANGDFHLTAHTPSASSLASPYNADPDGIVRGTAGVWDAGAYQLSTLTPAAPLDLRFGSN